MDVFYSNSTVIDSQTLEEKITDSNIRKCYRTDLCNLHDLPNYTCPWHWHDEVELFYMTQGVLRYFTPNQSCVFKQGDIGFVNANVLHMCESVSTEPPVQQEHIFLPGLLSCSANPEIDTQYILPLIQNEAAELLYFSADEAVSGQIRFSLDRAFRYHTENQYGRGLLIRNALSDVWLHLLERMPAAVSQPKNQDLKRVKGMIQYIEVHFAEHVSLDEIVGAVHLSRGEGNRCFQRVLHISPFTYLIGYRIERAKELITGTSQPLTDICFNCGFASMSYFGKLFKEKTNLTPSEYRMKFGRNE